METLAEIAEALIDMQMKEFKSFLEENSKERVKLEKVFYKVVFKDNSVFYYDSEKPYSKSCITVLV